MLYVVFGFVAIGIAVRSVITGKGHYKGCPAGGYDRRNDPFCFWAPTVTIFSCGLGMILLQLGIIR